MKGIDDIMATPVIMPRQGQSVESCIIGKWHKQKGDKITPGDKLFTYETDKATFTENAKAGGILLDIFFEEGDDVPCLTNVCVIGEAGEDTAEFNPNNELKKPDEKSGVCDETTALKVEEIVVTAVAVREAGEKLKISPRARNLAEIKGVDISKTGGSGPDGRIIERDIKAMIDKGFTSTMAAFDSYKSISGNIEGSGIGGRITTGDVCAYTPGNESPLADDNAPDYTEVPNTNIRKLIANAMHTSLSTMAQLTLNSSFDMTNINDFRAYMKSSKVRLGLPNITINDIILYACSRTLLNHEKVNANYFEDKMRLFKNAHIGMAVDTERGLVVPTLFNANKLSLFELSKRAKELAETAVSGSISPDLTSGGTFTVTNLGTLGIESFTPVINPPQTCILGVNTIETRVKMIDGEVKPYSAMTLSLTFDHRALDGAPAARFLKDLVANLENFTFLLALNSI